MNGHCSTCELEPICGYPYKPCDCCNQRKFREKPSAPNAAHIRIVPGGAAFLRVAAATGAAGVGGPEHG